MAQYAQEAEIDQQIQKVLKQPLSANAKRSMIKDIKKSSMAQQKRATSFSTILNISNSMVSYCDNQKKVGSSTLVFPMLFFKNGILTAITVSLIIGVISCRTTQHLLIHSKKSETDLPETLLRVLGVGWMRAFSISNIILLWCSGMIYQILIINQLYPLLLKLIPNGDWAPKTDITFNQLSFQWIGTMYTTLMTPLFIQKKLGFILKLLPYCSISVFTFIAYIIIRGVINLIKDPTMVIESQTWFTWDFPTLAGVYGMALVCQSTVTPIAKNNQDQSKNSRDISLAFVQTWIIYAFSGLFGALAIAGKPPNPDATTVLDYFDDNSVLVIQALLFLQLTIVYPVLLFITRSQFLNLFYELDRAPYSVFMIATFVYSISCLFIQMFEVDLTLIISLCGAVIGFMHEYLIPITLHLTCLYRDRSKTRDEQIRLTMKSSAEITGSDPLIQNVDMTRFSIEEEVLKSQQFNRTSFVMTIQSQRVNSKSQQDTVYGQLLYQLVYQQHCPKFTKQQMDDLMFMYQKIYEYVF
ncbi:hypothetical protein pb186bvf_003805 [Paramecium bursaria]